MIFDSGKPADPTTIELILPDIPPSGFEVLHAVTTTHKPTSQAAARRPRRRSMVIATDTIASGQVTLWRLGDVGQVGRVSRGSATFRAGKGEDGSMSSDSSVSPDQPPETAAPSQDKAAPPESAVKFTRTASIWTSLTAGFLI